MHRTVTITVDLDPEEHGEEDTPRGACRAALRLLSKRSEPFDSVVQCSAFIKPTWALEKK